MKPYNELPVGIQVMLEGYCFNDPYGLHPSTLYKNICGTISTVSTIDTAKIFAVSMSLVEMIKKENEDTE